MTTDNKADDTIEASIEGFESDTPPKSKAVAKLPQQVEAEKVRASQTQEKVQRYFRVGDKVKLISLPHGLFDAPNAPVWQGVCGCVGGTVAGHEMQSPIVRWDNGHVLTFDQAEGLRAMTPDDIGVAADNNPDRGRGFALNVRDVVKAPPKAASAPKATDTLAKGDWPAETARNREAWLSHAAALMLLGHPPLTPSPLWSCGYGKGGTRGSQRVSIGQGMDGRPLVFIRPTIHDKATAASSVSDALIRMGAVHSDCRAALPTWPEYPQPEAMEQSKTQATRLIKCTCEKCGFVFRTTAKWIPDDGLMNCPAPECGGAVGH